MSSAEAPAKKTSIFDRLSNTNNFTGVYAARFNTKRNVYDLGIKSIQENEKTNGTSQVREKEKPHYIHQQRDNSPAKKPVQKEQAEKKPSIFDRLSDKSSYTGVYAKRFEK